jgi:hypothetical protein
MCKHKKLKYNEFTGNVECKKCGETWNKLIAGKITTFPDTITAPYVFPKEIEPYKITWTCSIH